MPDILDDCGLDDAILMRLLGLVISEARKGVVSWMTLRIKEEKRFMRFLCPETSSKVIVYNQPSRILTCAHLLERFLEPRCRNEGRLMHVKHKLLFWVANAGPAAVIGKIGKRHPTIFSPIGQIKDSG